MAKTPPPPPPLIDVRLEHLLLFLFVAFLVYHFFLKRCIDGFSIGGVTCNDGTTCKNKCSCIIVNNNWKCNCYDPPSPSSQKDCKGLQVQNCESHLLRGIPCDDQYMSDNDGEYYQCNHTNLYCNIQKSETPCRKIL